VRSDRLLGGKEIFLINYLLRTRTMEIDGDAGCCVETLVCRLQPKLCLETRRGELVNKFPDREAFQGSELQLAKLRAEISIEFYTKCIPIHPEN
jgi:hypothetical protein